MLLFGFCLPSFSSFFFIKKRKIIIGNIFSENFPKFFDTKLEKVNNCKKIQPTYAFFQYLQNKISIVVCKFQNQNKKNLTFQIPNFTPQSGLRSRKTSLRFFKPQYPWRKFSVRHRLRGLRASTSEFLWLAVRWFEKCDEACYADQRRTVQQTHNSKRSRTRLP